MIRLDSELGEGIWEIRRELILIKIKHIDSTTATEIVEINQHELYRLTRVPYRIFMDTFERSFNER
jgi:hypothetical protein